jgi:Hemerythrin HHE cation binding domain
MKKVAEVQTMCAQHDQLRDVANRYRLEIARPGPDPRSLADCRWKLMRLVTGHLAYEGLHLYPALYRSGGRDADAARQMATEIEQLSAELQNHVRDWTGTRIESDWPGYRLAAEALVDTLVRRLDREEKELYPLLLMAKAA